MELIVDNTVNTAAPQPRVVMLILKNDVTVVGIHTATNMTNTIVLTIPAFIANSDISIGELSLKGPTSKVVLHQAGTMSILDEHVLIMIDCDYASWIEPLTRA